MENIHDTRRVGSLPGIVPLWAANDDTPYIPAFQHRDIVLDQVICGETSGKKRISTTPLLAT